MCYKSRQTKARILTFSVTQNLRRQSSNDVMASMLYQSTRGGVKNVPFEDVVFSGYAPDGGLYVPQTIPHIDSHTLLSWKDLSIAQVTAKVLSYFVSSNLRQYLPEICDRTFSHFESPSNPTPLRPLGPIHVLELFRGPTLAFKVKYFSDALLP